MLMAHLDRLYLQCVYCRQITLLMRTNPGTRLPFEWVKVEQFMRYHLVHCHPLGKAENLGGHSGFRVTTWSESLQPQPSIGLRVNLGALCQYCDTGLTQDPEADGWVMDEHGWKCTACQLFTPLPD